MISSPDFQVRASARLNANVSVVMFAPKETSSALSAPTKSATARCASASIASLACEVANGPPFHVADAELLGYWPRLSCVETREDIENGPPKFLEAGLTSLQEKVWRSA